MSTRAFGVRGNVVGISLVVLGLLLMAAAGVVYPVQPAAAQPTNGVGLPVLSGVSLACAAGGQYRLQGTATCEGGCPEGVVAWQADYPSGPTPPSPSYVAMGPFPINFDLTGAFSDDDPSILIAAFHGGGSSGWMELTKPACGLTIVKEATPADDTPFEFVCSPTGVPDSIVQDQYTASDFAPGCDFVLRDPSENSWSGRLMPMTLTELVPEGWTLDGISCDADEVFWHREGNTLLVHSYCPEDPTTTFQISVCIMPVDMTCTFHNSAYGRIIVKKVVPEGSPAASFIFDPSWSGVFNMVGGASSMPFEVPIGVHSVAEVALPAGWSLASASCDDGSNPAAIGVSPGELVTCTFVNRFEAEGGSLTVIKRTTPAGGAGFGFDGTLGAFSLGDQDSAIFEDLAAGLYTVTETPADGWEFEDVTCFGAAGAVVDWVADGSSVTVNLAEGQDVTCKFANKEEGTSGPEGSLTILKQTTPAGGAGFAFDGGALGAFSLDDGGSKTFTDLAAGAYVVTETPAADWEFASIECDALDFVVDGASVTVNLAEGEAAVCTFNNGELPYTGSSLWLPLLLGGLAVLIMGLGAWTFSYVRQADKR